MAHKEFECHPRNSQPNALPTSSATPKLSILQSSPAVAPHHLHHKIYTPQVIQAPYCTAATCVYNLSSSILPGPLMLYPGCVAQPGFVQGQQEWMEPQVYNTSEAHENVLTSLKIRRKKILGRRKWLNI